MSTYNNASTEMTDLDGIVECYVRGVRLSQTITDSFDSFVEKINPLISTLRPIHCTQYGDDMRFIRCSVSNAKLMQPRMLEKDTTSRPIYPQECRLRNLSYSGPLYIDINVERSNGENTIIRDVYMGRVPIMIYSSGCHVKDRVASKECVKDLGGYFIINGSEKTLIAQKGHVSNRIVSYKSKVSTAVAVKSEHNYRLYVTTIKHQAKRPLTVTFPRLENEMPLFTLVIALGVTYEDCKRIFTPEELVFLSPSLTNLPTDVEEARRRIHIRQVYDVGKSEDKRLDIALNIMLLPHVATDGSHLIKGIYLLLMVKELIAVDTGAMQPTDRDSVINQRVHMSYTLLSKLFLQLLIQWREQVSKALNMALSRGKNVSDRMINKIVSGNTSITDGLSFALATGNWNTVYVDRGNLKGVAQALERASYVATVSQLRKVSSSVDPDMKNPTPRFLPGTHYGRYCPAETPEGRTVGLETTLAISAHVSLETSATPILDIIKQYIKEITTQMIHVGHTVFVNGVYVGNTQVPERLLQTVRGARRSGQFAKDISISQNDILQQIHISTTFGRVTRPLLIVENGRIKDITKSWYEMISTGVIEYLDAEEENTCYVAFFPKDITMEHTHCEISNTFLNGINAACIPFSDHNPAPRNTFASAMGKQPMGVYSTSYQHRVDTTSNVLYYPQRPLVTTKIYDLIQMHQCPNGMNAIVAIMPFHGFGQEDSIIVKQEALDRGMGRADRYKTINDHIGENSREVSEFKKPTKRKRIGTYDKLDDDGLLCPGTRIDKRDCLIGKEKLHKATNVCEDVSTLSNNKARVVSTRIYQEKDGARGVKMKTRTVQVPVIGDKFASRHGQKGTIGMLYSEIDMPFTSDGIIPDIILNPLAIPSRMTIGHMLETLTGKVTSLSGKRYDASPFSGLKVEDIALALKECGFQPHGNEMMMNGITGEMIKAKIFIGPVFYQRLKHMVDYKLHARGRGSINQKTKQPIAGRSVGGALRVGEMEKDAIGSHGCAEILQDRMLHCSDGHTRKVGDKEVTMPYAASLLFDELKSMCIDTKIKM